MRRLLYNHVTIALVGVVLQIIASQYYHGVDCQKIEKFTREAVPVKPFLKKFEPQVSSTYKKFSKRFSKTLSKDPVDEEVEEVDKVADPEVGSVNNAYGYPQKITSDGPQTSEKYFDSFADEFVGDDGSDPVVGRSKRGSSNDGYGRRIGTMLDKFVGKILSDSGNSGKEDGSEGDPVVGSAKGASDSKDNGANFQSAMRRTGRIVDKLVNKFGNNSGNSEKTVDSGDSSESDGSSGSDDPVVGSAKGDVNGKSNGAKYEDRFHKSGKYVDIIMDGVFAAFESSEETNSGDSGSDPVVGSAKGAGASKNYGGPFEGVLHHTGKFVDVFVNDILGGSEETAGDDSVSDPVVGSAQGESNNEDSGAKFEHFLRKAGKCTDKFFNKLLGNFVDSEDNTGSDPEVGSANPNSEPSDDEEEISNDVEDDTEEPIEDPSTEKTPTSEELFEDSEDNAHEDCMEVQCDCKAMPPTDDDEELFTDSFDRVGQSTAHILKKSTLRPSIADKSNKPNFSLFKDMKFNFNLPVKSVPWKPFSAKNKQNLVTKSNEPIT